MTTEQTPNEAAARDELLRDAYQKLQPALFKFCSEMGPVLTGYDGAVILCGASAALLGVFAGPEIAAAALRGLADQLAAPAGSSLN